MEDAIEDENEKSTLPDGNTVIVKDDGTATVNLIQIRQLDTTKVAIWYVQQPTLRRPYKSSIKLRKPVATTSHLTDGGKAKVSEECGRR